jgi:TPR repeat protein
MGTEKDPSKAYKYLVRAVTAETPSALVPLATCYEKGIGCEPDAEKVVSLYEFACDLGNPEATFKVVRSYCFICICISRIYTLVCHETSFN